MPRIAQVYAIEKTAVGYGLIGQNCRRFHVTNVMAIQGTAPEALARFTLSRSHFYWW